MSKKTPPNSNPPLDQSKISRLLGSSFRTIGQPSFGPRKGPAAQKKAAKPAKR